MARINVDQQALHDARFARLAILRGWADADHARGKMLLVWNECIHRGAVLEVWVIEHHMGPGAGLDLLECALAELVKVGPAISRVAGSAGTSRDSRLVDGAGAGLVEMAGVMAGTTTLRIKGTDGRTDYLQKKVNAAILGGKARAASANRSGGKFASHSNQPVAGEVVGCHTSAPALAPAPVPDHTEGPAVAAPGDLVPDELSKAEKLAKRIERIPTRAWAAADYLRESILESAPDALVSKQPWGSDVRSGWRLSWADEIRLMVMRDGRTYEQIADVLRYVFREQTGTKKFIVQSADALRDKFDSIQAVRRSREDHPQQSIRKIQDLA